jgi:glycosyltransferase involved in cell wall biosynthesis
MNVLYFDPKFLTPRHAAPTRAYSIARRLVERGHEVTMVARDPRWLAVDATAPPGLLARRERVHGIDVIWMRIPYEQRFSKWQRLLSYGAYTFAATAASLGLRRPDVVYASSTPLTSGIPGAFASRLRGVPFVFELQDLWPAAPAALGYLTNRLELAAAESLERALYARSDRLVVCSEAVVTALVRRGIPPEKLLLVPNFSETDLFRPDQRDATFRGAHGLEGKFLAVYSGAMGATNGVYQLADAAAALKRRGDDRVTIVLVGDGNERPALEQRVAAERLDNVLFLAPQPREAMPGLVGACDVTVTVFAPHPALALNSPNKFFDSLAAGKPVVVNLDGWLRRLVEEHEAGVYVPAGDAEALAGALMSLAGEPERVREMGKNARDLAVREFSRDLLADRLAEDLERLAARNGARPAVG